MTDVTPSAETLMRQAPMTVEVYLLDAIKSINAAFGDDTYAKQHPELVGAFIAACTRDFHTANVRIVAQEIRDAINSLVVEARETEMEVAPPEAEMEAYERWVRREVEGI